jgi:hypothetical protein
MPNTWINQLEVSGPAPEVHRFRDLALRVDNGTALSFKRLYAWLPEEQQLELEEPYEPWGGSWPNEEGIEAPEEQTLQVPGMLRLVYDFSMARYAPDELLVAVSTHFPTICFVLGWVDPNNDEQSSKHIEYGLTDLYEAPDALVTQLRAEVYRRHGLDYEQAIDDDDDDQLWADIEGDWACRDAVVRHWDDRVAEDLSHVAESLRQNTLIRGESPGAFK